MTDQLIARRTVPHPVEQVFSVLADPAQHHHTEPGDWVKGPLDADPDPITGIGQVFGIEMFHVNAGGRYDMHNRVTAFVSGRTIEWEPGQYGEDDTLGAGGWRWRYDLEAVDDGTEVTMTYDWSAVPSTIREHIGFPPFPPEFLDESLACLDAHIASSATDGDRGDDGSAVGGRGHGSDDDAADSDPDPDPDAGGGGRGDGGGVG